MQKIRNWDKGYFFSISIQILKNYKLGKISDEFYPHAKEVFTVNDQMQIS
jgi:hypothetical protein